MVLLSCLAALAAPLQFVLPTGESAADWTPALEAAGIEVSATATSAGVTIEAVGQRWRLTVISADQVVHQVVLDPPRDADAREDVAWLVASLVRPATSLDLVPLLHPPPPLAPSAPQVAIVAPAAPPSEPEPEPPSGVPVTPTSIDRGSPTPDPDEIPEDDLEIGLPLPAANRHQKSYLWTSTGVHLGLREHAATAPGAAFTIGFARRGLRAGARACWTSTSVLDGAGPRRGVSSLDVIAGTWWAPRTGAMVGLGMGGSSRTWSDRSVTVASHTMPLIVIEVGAAADLGRGWRGMPTLRLQQDLAPTLVFADGEPLGRLSPTIVMISMGIDTVMGGDPFSDEWSLRTR